jgi:hypothetical protein
MNNPFTLSADGAVIHGEHFTVSNGFTKRVHDGVQLRYADLLAIEIVTRRPKRLFYALLLSASAFVIMEKLVDDFSTTHFVMVGLVICALVIVYAFSARKYAEITTMQGIYLIPIKRGDMEIQSAVSQLQGRIR